MPETAMDKDRSPVPWQNKIRPAWNIRRMEAKTEAHPVQCASDQLLRAGVLPPDACHHPASHLGWDNVCHLLSEQSHLAVFRFAGTHERQPELAGFCILTELENVRQHELRYALHHRYHDCISKLLIRAGV